MIIDKRSVKKKSVGNRKRFLKRYKDAIKHKVEELASQKGITDITKDRSITVPNTEEPTFRDDPARGKQEHVRNGNEELSKGDKIRRPPEDNGRGASGSDTGEGLDEFTFTLTKAEFLELYFSDLELPNFIKNSLAGSDKEVWKRHGYSREGVPARLDLLKTLKQSIARRIATKSKLYLDNIDMVFRHFTKQTIPIKKAVMFCLMDVSASMDEDDKALAKKFYILLYLFLQKNYQQVDLRFITHTQDAMEVDEEEFFYGTRTGGTVVSSGLQLVDDIIKSEYDLSTNNIYLAQASDGDNFSFDTEQVISIARTLLQKVQYFSYIELDTFMRENWPDDNLFTVYQKYLQDIKNFKGTRIQGDEDVYPALRELFGG